MDTMFTEKAAACNNFIISLNNSNMYFCPFNPWYGKDAFLKFHLTKMFE